MPKIKILDPVCVSKIAAGEVVERPASVVKELIENAIDASATEIRLTILNGGKDLIEVKDNGMGIPPDDLPLTVKRHATSKISSERDLESISTMGFRGEALYSIASVSRFSITSRTAEDELATCITVEGDVEKTQVSETIMATSGTTVSVRDLFFNFIVRRKFLKKASIEHANIYDVVAQYAVSQPNISFTFMADNELEFQTVKSKSHISAIRETYGKVLADSLLDIGIAQRNGVIIHGYLSKPGHHKRNRKYQHFFLNGRRIQSKILQSALEEGYGSYLMKREFPVAFFFLEIDPKDFDVNIHPQKREVLFYNENELIRAVSSVVAHCLKTQDIVPHLKPRSKHKKLSVEEGDLTSAPQKMGMLDTKQLVKVQPEIKPSELPNHIDSIENQLSTISTREIDTIDFLGSNLKFRGPLGNEFLLLEDLSNHDLIILDFHAAHERVNLEQFTMMVNTGKVSSQTFLKPFRFFVTPEQRVLMMESLSYLNNMGFDIRSPKGNKRQLEVYAIPMVLRNTDLKKFLNSLLETLPKTVIEDQIKELLSLIACHTSYRAGDTLSYRQTKDLLQELAQVPNPTTCAHGRPTYIRVSYQDLMRQVRRI
ncbi:MAG: DNA mismatch repair endonuclease MutL [Candidatus Heimdallarchaeota archaeon]|nr:MAG: DNA mismatch repair endonuclease MutL [Candidatus Heimdallarchaeota archaeon]